MGDKTLESRTAEKQAEIKQAEAELDALRREKREIEAQLPELAMQAFGDSKKAEVLRAARLRLEDLADAEVGFTARQAKLGDDLRALAAGADEDQRSALLEEYRAAEEKIAQATDAGVGPVRELADTLASAAEATEAAQRLAAMLKIQRRRGWDDVRRPIADTITQLLLRGRYRLMLQ